MHWNGDTSANSRREKKVAEFMHSAFSLVLATTTKWERKARNLNSSIYKNNFFLFQTRMNLRIDSFIRKFLIEKCKKCSLYWNDCRYLRSLLFKRIYEYIICVQWLLRWRFLLLAFSGHENLNKALKLFPLN